MHYGAVSGYVFEIEPSRTFSKQKRHLLQSLAAAASMQSKLQRSIRRQMIGGDPHVQGT